MYNAIIFGTMIGAHPSTKEMLLFSLIGFCVVMFVLLVLSFVMSVIGIIFRAVDSAKAKAAAKAVAAQTASAAQPAPAAQPAAEDTRILAVIAAAVSVALDGAKHRIASVKMVSPNFAWSRSGRQEIFSSRNFRPARKS